MYTIGLTGGIASGKSTVSKMLAVLGATIIDTDEIAHLIVGCDEPAWHDIVAHFGSSILLPDGNIDRKKLGEKIFANQFERQCLEEITHPYIEEQVQQSMEKAANMGESIVVLDVPLLFETGWHKKVDAIWVVYVDEKVQLERLMSRNNFTYEQAISRMNSQMSLMQKKKLANVIIDNNLDVEYTKQQVMREFELLRQG